MIDQSWLAAQQRSLLDFGRGAFSESRGGYGRTDLAGVVDLRLGLETWVNGRMTYCFALDVLAGTPSSLVDAERAGAALGAALWDEENGGWFECVGGEYVPGDRKAAYAHAFGLLAAVSLIAVGSPLGDNLFERARGTIDTYFWLESEQACRESWTRDWSHCEPYRGMNSNMHMTEAFLAAFDVTGERLWLDRAQSIADRLVNGHARANGWRIPEHYTADWQPVLDYNVDDVNHPFRPYGYTMGHSLEWARLLVHLREARRGAGLAELEWIMDASVNLFHRAVDDGWARIGADGFSYTVDASGAVVNPLHLGWVTCEAISAATVLAKATGEAVFAQLLERFWDYAARNLVDTDGGSWFAELDDENVPSFVIWPDKPDFYHPLQSILLFEAPLRPSLLSGGLDLRREDGRRRGSTSGSVGSPFSSEDQGSNEEGGANEGPH